MMLGTTLVLRRRFKPATVLADIEKHKVTAIVVVPVMLSRAARRAGEDGSPSRTCRACGSCSSPARSWAPNWPRVRCKDLGPVIYNLYGSTEIAFATIARPKDLSINPATVGPVGQGHAR